MLFGPQHVTVADKKNEQITKKEQVKPPQVVFLFFFKGNPYPWCALKLFIKF